jgi:cytoskeletal protein RodZ
MSVEPIGEKLKKIRQNKGLSLEDVHKKTKIHLNILKAIEGESLTNLSPIYLKGFLKIYCKFLGIDPKECIPDYKEPSQSSIKKVATTTVASREDGKPLKTPSFMENASLKLNTLRPDKKLRNIIIFILIVVVSGIILFKLVRFISNRPRVSPAVANIQAQRAQVKPKVKPQNPSAIKPAVTETTRLPKGASGGISLVIAAKDNCLVFVKVDGRVVMHRVLERGRSDSWKAKEKIELNLGNAAAVELIVNGQRFTNLGRRGQQLKNITITEKDGLRIPR